MAGTQALTKVQKARERDRERRFQRKNFGRRDRILVGFLFIFLPPPSTILLCESHNVVSRLSASLLWKFDPHGQW